MDGKKQSGSYFYSPYKPYDYRSESIVMVGPPPIVQPGSSTSKALKQQKKHFVKIQQKQKSNSPRNKEKIRFVTKKNTESLNNGVIANTNVTPAPQQTTTQQTDTIKQAIDI